MNEADLRVGVGDTDHRPGKEADSVQPTGDKGRQGWAPVRPLRTIPAGLRDWRIAFGMTVLLACSIVALVAPLISPQDPHAIGVVTPLIDSNLAHPMGADAFGRDYFSRVIFGTRISVIVALLVAASSMAVGLPLGLVLGYFGGRLDLAVSRILDLMFAFPGLLLALVLVTILGPGTKTVIIALAVIYIPIVARFIRGATAAERNLPYVMAIRISGASHMRIMARHILPNIASQLLVIASLIMAFAVLAEAGLSFIGLGVQPPDASWGRLLTENRGYLSTAPHLVFYPGVAITTLVLALSLLGDGLRDRLDPRQRRTSGRS